MTSVPGGLSSSESLFIISDTLACFSGQAGFLVARLLRNTGVINNNTATLSTQSAAIETFGSPNLSNKTEKLTFGETSVIYKYPPFLRRAFIPETLCKRVVVDLQLCYLWEGGRRVSSDLSDV